MALLIAVLVWGTIYVNITLPIIILAISANVANFTMALSAHIDGHRQPEIPAQGIPAADLA